MNKQTENNTRKAGPGRPKGSPNKTTALVKDAVIQAAEKAGDKEGMIGYLTRQADENPVAFMGLLGKVLPTQLSGNVGLKVYVRSNIDEL